MEFTAEEYTDMIICYGMADQNIRGAVRVYAERFPNRERLPSRKVIENCLRRVRETGNVMPDYKNRGGAPGRIAVRDEEEVLQDFEDNPRNSVRRAAFTHGLSRSTVHQILKRNNLHPFHYQRVQQLLERDKAPRVYFCEGFLAQCRRNASFPDNILWTDEATFTPNGVFNSKNFVTWHDENPRAVRQCAFQYRWSINVWAGMIADRVIGPFFLPPRLHAITYADFLKNELPVLLEDVPLDAREKMMFQHDGAPAHSSLRAREILNERFPGRWLGRGGPITWPPRSPDLNVLDYFLWGYIKASVENWRDGTAYEMSEAIVAAFNTVTPDMAHRATRQIIRRAELCIEMGGKHFEQLLH